MLSDIVIPGEIVEMESVRNTISENRENEEKRVYRTKVFDVLTEDQLEVMMPVEKGKLILLPTDGEFNLCFYTSNGLYQCYAKVIDRYKSNNVYIAVLELTSNLRKHQRREYYRFSCALEMDSRALETEEVKAVEEQHLYLVPGLPLKHSVIVDISGGGLRFIANYRYDVGSLIYCNYNLMVKGAEKQYHLVGKVLAVRELEERPGDFEHRVQYMNMDADEREEIIRYIFEEERKQRHKKTNNK